MLARTPALCRAGPEASSPAISRRPPAPAFPVKKPSAAHRHQPPDRAKPVIAPHLWSCRQGGPRPPPAAPPHPAPASPHTSLQRTHGDPGPRAAAAEGTSGPGRPAGAERQAKGRGPRRAGEVAHPTPQRAVSGTLRYSTHAPERTLLSRVLLRTNRSASCTWACPRPRMPA